MENVLIIKVKLQQIGFRFNQSEFCYKGLFVVDLDCSPYLAISENGKSLWFKAWEEFITFYNENHRKQLNNNTMNTLENKAKFFAQYWWQDVFILGLNGQRYRITKSRFNAETLTKECWLSLKPLSSITDEDAIEVLNILMGSKDFMFKDWHKSLQEKWLKTIKIDLLDGFGSRQTGIPPYFKSTWHTGDYLRSKGYALPWNGISVEQQIEYGWIKLID